jgi:hypothetical protein
MIAALTLANAGVVMFLIEQRRPRTATSPYAACAARPHVTRGCLIFSAEFVSAAFGGSPPRRRPGHVHRQPQPQVSEDQRLRKHNFASTGTASKPPWSTMYRLREELAQHGHRIPPRPRILEDDDEDEHPRPTPDPPTPAGAPGAAD